MKWRHTRAPLDESALQGAELLLQVRFPADYRGCLRVNHGATPDPAGFLVPAEENEFGSGVGCLLSIDPYASENLFAALSDLAVDEQLPRGVVPIATDGGGDYVCLDYRADPKREAPVIVYWSHELEGDEAFTHLASTFTEFLAQLEKETEEGA